VQPYQILALIGGTGSAERPVPCWRSFQPRWAGTTGPSPRPERRSK